MPLTAAIIQADLAAIALDITGAMESVVIGGVTLSAFRGNLSQSNDQMASGDHAMVEQTWTISAEQIDDAALTVTPGTTEATVGATTYLITSLRQDPFRAFYILTYVEETRP